MTSPEVIEALMRQRSIGCNAVHHPEHFTATIATAVNPEATQLGTLAEQIGLEFDGDRDYCSYPERRLFRESSEF
jgi:hypothetical protein